MEKDDKIFIAGHQGLVGSAIVRALQKDGFKHLLLRSRTELDLTNQENVNKFFTKEQPKYVFLAAAKVGGIHANNTYRGDFIYQNLMIQSNVIEAARRHAVKKLLFLGSSCIYPRNCPQPMREEYLLQGPLEPTNEPYAVAKIAGIKLCESYNYQYGTDFMTAMPTNLYGPGDNFDLLHSHVLPALLRKIHEAKMTQATHATIWGTGTPLREFLHVDDMAAACLCIMQQAEVKTILNIGSGQEVSIRQLVDLICDVISFKGEIIFDATKPDGMPRKRLDVTKLNQLGWTAKIDLPQGIRATYKWFKTTHSYS